MGAPLLSDGPRDAEEVVTEAGRESKLGEKGHMAAPGILGRAEEPKNQVPDLMLFFFGPLHPSTTRSQEGG